MKWLVKNALISKLPNDVLDRLAHPEASGNEAYRFLLEYLGELGDVIRSQTENLIHPVVDVELRQARGALHVIRSAIDMKTAAALLQIDRSERTRKEQARGEKP